MKETQIKARGFESRAARLGARGFGRGGGGGSGGERAAPAPSRPPACQEMSGRVGGGMVMAAVGRTD